MGWARFEAPPLKNWAKIGWVIILRRFHISFLPPTLIPLSGVGTICFFFHHVVIKIRNYFYDRPPALKLEWVLTIANATGINGLTSFRITELEIINFGRPSYDWPLRPVLSFRDRAPSALTARPSS
jgi:hypothetical protein